MDNAYRLNYALSLALADKDFMGSNKKVDHAVDALTPKDTLTATLKRLQINARKDFLDKKDQGCTGYIDEAKVDKIKEYVHSRFKGYMEAPKTSKKATDLFEAAYPKVIATAGEEETDPASEDQPAADTGAEEEPEEE